MQQQAAQGTLVHSLTRRVEVEAIQAHGDQVLAAQRNKKGGREHVGRCSKHSPLFRFQLQQGSMLSPKLLHPSSA